MTASAVVCKCRLVQGECECMRVQVGAHEYMSVRVNSSAVECECNVSASAGECELK